METEVLGILVTLTVLNLSVIMFAVRALRNGKPVVSKNGNPTPIDPDHILLGTISLAYFEECLKRQTNRLIRAIGKNPSDIPED